MVEARLADERAAQARAEEARLADERAAQARAEEEAMRQINDHQETESWASRIESEEIDTGFGYGV